MTFLRIIDYRSDALKRCAMKSSLEPRLTGGESPVWFTCNHAPTIPGIRSLRDTTLKAFDVQRHLSHQILHWISSLGSLEAIIMRI